MSEEFQNHPGYSAIMENLPQMHLAICGHPELTDRISPIGAAISHLIFLYEALEEWEAGGHAPVSAKDDFGHACDILAARIHRLDLANPHSNAMCASNELAAYKNWLEDLPESSVNHAKASHHV